MINGKQIANNIIMCAFSFYGLLYADDDFDVIKKSTWDISYKSWRFQCKLLKHAV